MNTSRIATVVLCLLLLPLEALAVCSKNQPGWLWNYNGELAGKYRIRMTLVFAGEEVSGVYFYASSLKDIPLRGRMLDATHVRLEELDAAGNTAATFDAEFPEKDPESAFGDSALECEVIRGTWSKAGSDAKLPVFLQMEGGSAGSIKHRYAAIGARDPETVHRNSQAFWLAVKRDDRKTAASLIRYPIRVDTSAGRKRYASAEELLVDYELVFTPAFRESIAKGLPRNMFVRDQGAMLGNGQVWFGADGKVTALNNY
jgi:hypothetical protein